MHSGAYGLITGIFLTDVVVLLRMKGAKQSTQQVHESPVRSLIGGLKYVWGNHTVLVLLVPRLRRLE